MFGGWQEFLGGFETRPYNKGFWLYRPPVSPLQGQACRMLRQPFDTLRVTLLSMTLVKSYPLILAFSPRGEKGLDHAGSSTMLAAHVVGKSPQPLFTKRGSSNFAVEFAAFFLEGFGHFFHAGV